MKLNLQIMKMKKACDAALDERYQAAQDEIENMNALELVNFINALSWLISQAATVLSIDERINYDKETS